MSTTSPPTRGARSSGSRCAPTVWGHELALTSGSGVFAQGRLDVGTAVLFRETEPPRRAAATSTSAAGTA